MKKIILLSIVSIFIYRAISVPVDHQGNMKLFIIAGQSNASGRGILPTTQTENAQVYVFGNDYHWRLLLEPSDDFANQVDAVSADDDAAFSFAYPFAIELLRTYPDMIIGVIPCARGGTSLYEWRRQLGDDTLYGSCLKRARAASVMGEISAILFYQGEKDARDPALFPELELYPNSWAVHFEELAAAWRADLGLPNLPIVYAQIGTTTDPILYPNWGAVRTQQALVSFPNCHMVLTDDVPLQDTAHFTTYGYRLVGRRFSAGYVDIIQNGEACN